MNGVRQYVALGADEQKARAAHAQLVADKESGRLARGSRSTALRQVLERWLESVSPRLKPATVDTYQGAIERLCDWFGENNPVERIRTADIHEFVEQFRADGYSHQYTTNTLTVLRQGLTRASRDGLIDAVPVVTLEHQRHSPKSKNRLTIPECEAVVAALKGPWRPMGEFILLTGVRRGEALGLTWSEVDFERAFARVSEDGNITRYGRHSPKSQSSIRTVPLSPAAVALIKGLPRGSERVFGDLGVNGADHAMKAALDKTGLRGHRRGWHSLRHAHTALLDAAGESLRGAAARLGHTRIDQTWAYGWAAEAGDAAAIDEARIRQRGTSPGGE